MPRGAWRSVWFGLALVLCAPWAAAQAPRELNLVFAGDIMGHDANYRMSDFHDIYRGVEGELRSADLAFANLEFPLDPARGASGYPYFNGTPGYLAAALDSGFDLFSLANNHAFDGGIEGVYQTLRVMERERAARARPFAYSGTRGNPLRPFLPVGMVVNGIRVGFLAATQFLNERGGGRFVYVVDYADAVQVREFVRQVRRFAPLYDLFIVSYHGDREYVQSPSPAKREFFRELLGAGVHIVVGHHPHVIQPFEMVPSGTGARLAAYSLGNFISGMTWMLVPPQLSGALAATGESYLLRVRVLCDGAGCRVVTADPIPIANYLDDRREMVVARLSDLADGSVKLSPSWKAYYAGRLSLMERFLSGSGRSAPAP